MRSFCQTLIHFSDHNKLWRVCEASGTKKRPTCPVKKSDNSLSFSGEVIAACLHLQQTRWKARNITRKSSIRGLYNPKIDKALLIYSVSYFNLGGSEFCLPTKAPCGDRNVKGLSQTYVPAATPSHGTPWYHLVVLQTSLLLFPPVPGHSLPWNAQNQSISSRSWCAHNQGTCWGFRQKDLFGKSVTVSRHR